MWNQDLFKQKTHARREEVISKEMIEAIKGSIQGQIKESVKTHDIFCQ
jgi:hypothetical protein